MFCFALFLQSFMTNLVLFWCRLTTKQTNGWWKTWILWMSVWPLCSTSLRTNSLLTYGETVRPYLFTCTLCCAHVKKNVSWWNGHKEQILKWTKRWIWQKKNWYITLPSAIFLYGCHQHSRKVIPYQNVNVVAVVKNLNNALLIVFFPSLCPNSGPYCWPG